MDSRQAIVYLVVGTFLPLLIAVIQRRSWADEVRFGVALAVYVVTALLGALYTETVRTDAGLDWRAWVDAFFPLMVGSVSSFQLVWKRGLARVIEEKTTPGDGS